MNPYCFCRANFCRFIRCTWTMNSGKGCKQRCPETLHRELRKILLYVLILREEAPKIFTVPINVILVSICDLFNLDARKECFLTPGEIKYARTKANAVDLRPTKRNTNPLGKRVGRSAYELSLLNAFLELTCPISSTSQNPMSLLGFCFPCIFASYNL